MKENERPITISILNDKLDKFRWEMRALLIIGVVVGRYVPIEDVARALAAPLGH